MEYRTELETAAEVTDQTSPSVFSPRKNSGAAATLTIVELVYHQGRGQEPTCVDSRFSKPLASDEQPYIRRLKVAAQWLNIGIGWLEEASQVVITNSKDGKPLLLHCGSLEAPGRAEWIIPPGESFRGQPALPERLWLCSPQGETTCTVHVFPK